MMENISIVICTRNRPTYLKKCIASIFDQSVRPREIIVVDDASDEKINVREMLNSVLLSINEKISRPLAKDIRIKYMRNRRRHGIVRSRNLGIAAAKGDIIAFIDDDGYAHKNWIKNLFKHYRNRRIVGVGGPVVEVGRHVEVKTNFKRLSYVTRYGDIKHNYRVKKFRDTKELRCGAVKFLMGGNMSFRRGILLNLRGFSTKYKGNYYREETDMCMRASKVGKVIFEPSAVAYHNTAKYGGTRDVTHLEKFFYWYFRNTTLLFFRNFDMTKAFSKTWRQFRKYVRGVRNGTIKVNRDYLIMSASFKVLLAILTGTVAGVLIGIAFDMPLKKLAYKHPEYAILFTVAMMGTTLQIIDQRTIENIVSSVDKL